MDLVKVNYAVITLFMYVSLHSINVSSICDCF